MSDWPKLGCKFELVLCPKVYKKKKIDQFGPSKDPGGPFFMNGPLELALQDQFLVHFWAHEGPGGPPDTW